MDSSLYPAILEKCTVTGIESGENEEKPGKVWYAIGSLLWALVGMLPGMPKCSHVPFGGVGACRDGCTVKIKHYWCMKAGCEVCFKYRVEINRTLNRMVERIRACVDLHELIGKPIGLVNHVIVSPVQDWGRDRMETIGGMKHMKRELYRHLKMAGMKGGYAVFHPWRVRSWAKEAFKVAKSKGYGHGIWDWLRESDLLRPGKKAIYFSPHYHVFGWGYLIDSKVFYAKTGGWTYKKKPKGLAGDDLEGSISYVLTHRGVMLDIETKKKVQMISTFGILHHHVIGKEEHLHKTTDVCPECSTDMEYIEGWEETRLDDGTYSIKCQYVGIDGEPMGIVYTGVPYPKWERKVKYWLKEHLWAVVKYGTVDELVTCMSGGLPI